MLASAGMQADMKALHKMLVSRHVMYKYNHNKPMSVSAAAQLLSNTLYYKRFFPYYTFNLCAGLDADGGCSGCSGRGLLSGPGRSCGCRATVVVVHAAGGPGAAMAPVVPAPLVRAGRGAVYNYDAIGSYERSGHFCQVGGRLASWVVAECGLHLACACPWGAQHLVLDDAEGWLLGGTRARSQGSGKELIQPVLDNQLQAASPLLVPPQVSGPKLTTMVHCAGS